MSKPALSLDRCGAILMLLFDLSTVDFIINKTPENNCNVRSRPFDLVIGPNTNLLISYE